MVAGRVAGEEIFRWIVNEELYAACGLGGWHEEPDESTQAVERAAAVEAIRVWAHRSGLPDIDAERVKDVLARGYVLAEGSSPDRATLATLAISAAIGREEISALPHHFPATLGGLSLAQLDPFLPECFVCVWLKSPPT